MEKDLEHIARKTMDHFVKINTWVNNARGMFGEINKERIADLRRLFDTNFGAESMVATPRPRKSTGQPGPAPYRHIHPDL